MINPELNQYIEFIEAESKPTIDDLRELEAFFQSDDHVDIELGLELNVEKFALPDEEF